LLKVGGAWLRKLAGELLFGGSPRKEGDTGSRCLIRNETQGEPLKKESVQSPRYIHGEDLRTRKKKKGLGSKKLVGGLSFGMKKNWE